MSPNSALAVPRRLAAWSVRHPLRAVLLLLFAAWLCFWQGGAAAQAWQVDDANTFALSPDGRVIALGGDAAVELRQVADGQAVRLLTANNVHALAFSPDGRYLAAGGWDRLVRVWNVHDGALLYTLRELAVRLESDGVESLAFTPDSQFLFAGDRQDIYCWQVSTGSVQQHFTAHNLRGLAVSPDGRLLAATQDAKEKYTVLWDIRTGSERQRLPANQQPTRLAFSPDGRYLAVGMQGFKGGGVALWRVDTQPATLEQRFVTTDWTFYVAFSADGRYLAAGGDEPSTGDFWPTDPLPWLRPRPITIWPVGGVFSGGPRRTLRTPQRGVSGLAFAPDTQTLVAIGDEYLFADSHITNGVRFWRIQPGGWLWDWLGWMLLLVSGAVVGRWQWRFWASGQRARR